MKYLIILLVVAGLAGGGFWLAHAKRVAAENASATSVPTEEVTRRDIFKMVSANGAVSSNRDVDIKCQASGFIKTLPYTDVSAEVKPGDLLCLVDPNDENRLLETAKAVVDADNARIVEAQFNVQSATMALETTRQRDEAALASSEARAKQARAKAERTQKLFEDKLASQEDLETDQTAAAQADADVLTSKAAIAELEQQKVDIQAKETTIKEMQAALKQDQFRADTAQQNVNYCTVTAPGADDPQKPRWFISSILANIAPGYLVQSGSSGFSAGTTIMTLSDLSHIYVLATVDESDIGQVVDPNRDPNHTQQKCKITVDAYPGVQFDGLVQRVATKGVSTSNVVTFEVKIEVTSENRILLRPLMTATVKIISAERDNALVIPQSAFMRGDPTEQEQHTAAPGDATPSSQPASRPSGRGRRGGGGGGGYAYAGGSKETGPVAGTVTIVNKTGGQETRNVTVGLNGVDASGLGDYAEVLSGLDEGDAVLTNKSGGESKWSGQGQGQGRGQRPFIPR